MKTRTPSPLLLISALAIAAVLWLVWPDGTPPPGTGETGRNDPDPAAAAGRDPAAEAPVVREPAAAAAQRTVNDDEENGAGEEFPATDRLVLRIVSQETGAPVARAEALSFRAGEELGISGADGILELRVIGGAQIVVAAKGFLLRLVSLMPRSAGREPPVVELVPDRYTLAQRFRFVDDGRKVVDSVSVRFHPDWSLAESSSPLASMPTLPAGTPNPVLRAWNDHLLVATTVGFRAVALQAGHMNAERTFVLEGDSEVRFAQPGTYRLRASTPAGLVGSAVFQVPGSTLTVPLQAGRTISGVVLASEDGSPVVGARVAPLGGDPMDNQAVTDVEGRFRLSPVAPGAVTIEVTHPDRETIRRGPILADGELELRMTPLQTRTLRGRVLARPSFEALGDAEVIVTAGGRPVARSRTDVHGNFVAEVPSGTVLRLSIERSGFLGYSEILVSDAGQLDFVLLPADPQARVRAGLSTLLIGTVVDRAGAPVPGVTVRLDPERPSMPALEAGRRVLEGGVLSPPLTVTTDASGAFRLETVQEGRASLSVLEDAGTPPAGLPLVLVRGEVREGLRLVTTGTGKGGDE